MCQGSQKYSEWAYDGAGERAPFQVRFDDDTSEVGTTESLHAYQIRASSLCVALM